MDHPPHLARPPRAFAAVLRLLRQRAGLSQEQLALNTSVSQRQISTFESSRAAPTRASVDRLILGLHLASGEASALRRAAGFADVPAPTPSAEDDALVRELLLQQLRLAEPCPALAADVLGNVVATNSATDALLTCFGGDALWASDAGVRNLYRLTFHPDGLLGSIINIDSLAPAVKWSALADADYAPELLNVFAELEAEAGRSFGDTPPEVHGPVAESYRLGDIALTFHAMVTTLARAPAWAARWRVHQLLPADAVTEQFLSGLT